MLTGCQTVKNRISDWQPNAGPTLKQVESSVQGTDEGHGSITPNGLTIIDIDGRTANRANELLSYKRFSDYYRGGNVVQQVIRPGDVVNVALYEAPPALLFGSAADIANTSGSAEKKLPDQMVDSRGQISIPFLGKINVAGKSPQQVQDMIANGLSRKANKPSAIVSIGKNNSANITVVGEVNNSLRVPLTGKGERVLDAIAAAGGTKYPSSRVTVQVNRGMQSVEMPLADLLNDAKQNIVLSLGD